MDITTEKPPIHEAFEHRFRNSDGSINVRLLFEEYHTSTCGTDRFFDALEESRPIGSRQAAAVAIATAVAIKNLEDRLGL